MAIHLRQICLVAGKLGPVAADLEAVFGTPICHVDPGVGKFGLENFLMAFGTQFIEVVAPLKEGTAAGRYLQRRGGDGGYMVITQVPDKVEQDAIRTNAAANKVRVAYDSDRGDWHLMQLHPGDMRAAFLEVEWDSEADVVGNWHPAGGKDWMDKASIGSAAAVTGVELQSDEPEALAQHWAAVAGLSVEMRDGVPGVALANAVLKFVRATDGRGAGLGAVDVKVSDIAHVLAAAEKRGLRVSDTEVRVAGTRFNLTN